ncbi:hypothetical protein [Sharpea azabuensis]|uniref:hypothetical protein n=1 Tax=Sharpea azabuensis TaxID=322505 RepID=UPI001569E052|nr:hypothetical protein [Sharpea azabuensis]
MAFKKITDEDRAGKGNVGQSDTPGLTTAEMQEVMDSLPNLAIDKFNELIDALNETTAAVNMGATVPDGITAQPNVQSILNAMVLNLALNTQSRHTHANKTALDGLTQEGIDDYNRLSILFTAILSLETAITDNDAALPTSGAVVDYVTNYDMKAKVLAAAYPVGSVYCTKGTSPTTLFGGTWNLLDTDAQGVKRYERTA